jgi:hypothetical protein
MVRIYSPKREDGLVEWRVPGKRRAARTTRLDATRSENGVDERNLGPKGEDNAGHAPARSVRRTGGVGERREGRAQGDPVEMVVPQVKSA